MFNCNKSSTKVLIALPCIGDGGIETLVFEWIKELVQYEYKIDIFTQSVSSQSNKQKFESLGVKIFCSQYTNSEPMKKYKYLRNIMAREKYDVFHLNTCFSPEFYLLKAAKKEGITFRIAHGHNTNCYKGNWRQVVQRIFRNRMLYYSTICTGCTIEACKEIVGTKGVESSKYKILYNGVDTEKFRFNIYTREKVRKKLHIENKYVIGHVGRFTKQKNHSYIIELFNRFSIENNNAVLLLIGDGELKKEIEDKIISYGLKDKVILLGAIDNVQDYLSAMDCFLFPSLFEGFGIALLEAEANGIPVVTSTEIVKEVIIGNNVEQIGLNEDENKWIEALKCEKNLEYRLVAYKKIKKAGFDITDNSILKFYKEVGVNKC